MQRVTSIIIAVALLLATSFSAPAFAHAQANQFTAAQVKSAYCRPTDCITWRQCRLCAIIVQLAGAEDCRTRTRLAGQHIRHYAKKRITLS